MDHKHTHSGLLLFLRELFANPAKMGAAWPSSNVLARIIAAQIAVEKTQVIVELGSGTGVITAGLLKHGIPAEKLVLIERSLALSEHLRKRFPQLKVINGDARELSNLLNSTYRPVHVIVSSLPLRSLTDSVVQTIGQQIEQVLEPQGLYIQFTYSLLHKPEPPSPRLHHKRSHYVWWNLPPARVEVFGYD